MYKRQPTYNDDLHRIEDSIISAHSGQIETAYWHKTKPNGSTSELNEPKTYSEVLWEAGLGPKWFVKRPGNHPYGRGLPTYIKTFGSFIDPLEKNNANSTWPPGNGDTVIIDESAMRAMGFPDCHLQATTNTGAAAVNTPFQFSMTIGTGEDCSRQKPCIITETTPEYKKYFAGNKTKNEALKKTKGKGPATEEKVKMIMVKEWGDKMQCLIYLLKHRSTPPDADNKAVMTSCDKVVYILCLLLKVDFIYSGYDTPTPDTPKYKHYAISHFRPIDDPVFYMEEQCKNAKLAIASSNEGFISFLSSIKSDTKFRLANTYDVYNLNPTEGFIPGCILDIRAYTQDAETKIDGYIDQIKLIKRSIDAERQRIQAMPESNAAEAAQYLVHLITQQKVALENIEKDIATIKEQNTVVPFMKVKKGNQAHLTCNQASRYTLKPGALPAVLWLKPNLRKAFDDYYGLDPGFDEVEFARIPFFQLIRGKNKDGIDLELRSGNKVSTQFSYRGGRVQKGGSLTFNSQAQDITNVLFERTEPERTVERTALIAAAQLIGYTPDPSDPTTWDKYIVRGIMEAPEAGYRVDDDGEEDVFLDYDPLTEIDLEANLITGIRNYCINNGNMNLFDTLYDVAIYLSLIHI